MESIINLLPPMELLLRKKCLGYLEMEADPIQRKSATINSLSMPQVNINTMLQDSPLTGLEEESRLVLANK